MHSSGHRGAQCPQLKHNGIQLVFGHHRIRAAIAAGIREDDIKVLSDIGDADMTRMYASENATQRGNSGTALAGSVASAVKFLARGVMTGTIVTEKFFSQFDIDMTRRHFVSRDGMGRELISCVSQGCSRHQ